MSTIRWSCSRVLLGLALALGEATVASARDLPREVFAFRSQDTLQGRGAGRFDELTRAEILSAIRSPDRDSALARVQGIESRISLGERWFDLRGLQVFEGELGPGVSLTRLCLDHAVFRGVDLSGSDLSGALLRGARFSDGLLMEADFFGAELEGSDFLRMNMERASFRAARFGAGAVLRVTNLEDAVFDNATGSLSVAGGSCNRATFHRASLPQSEFTLTRLEGASFAGAELRDADFFGSVLKEVDFSDATLSGSRLGNAKVFEQVRLVRTTLEGAYLGDVVLDGLDIRYLRWPQGRFMLGEELSGDSIPVFDESTNRSKADEYAKAEVVYRALATKYRQLGYFGEYRALRFRAFDVRLKYLRLVPGDRAEEAWLNLYRVWDGYGTSVRRLVRNGVISLFGFAAVYLVGLLGGRRWFAWSWVGDEDRKLTRAYSVEPHLWLRRSGWRTRVLTLLRIGGECLVASLDALLTFADPLFRLQSIVRMFRSEPVVLKPRGLARPLVAIEATVGVVLAWSVTAHVIGTFAR